MRVLFTAPLRGDVTLPGGISKNIREIATNLVKRGHECTVISLNTMGLEPEENLDGVRIIRINSPIGKHLYGLSFGIYRFLRSNGVNQIRPDVVHVHGFHSLLAAELIYVFKKMRLPIVFSPHYDVRSHDTLAGEYLWGLYRTIIGRRIFSIPDLIICASEFEAKMVEKDLHVSASKIKIIPHGVDKITTKNKKKKDGMISLLYVGHILELKGIQHILPALRELVYTYGCDAVLTIVGEGVYKKKLVSLAKELRVADHITWKPFLPRSKLYKEYENADIFLLLSRSENYGIVVAEALACGTPCIVANTTALKEFTKEPGCFGVDYPPDPKKLAELIIKIHESDVQVGPFSRKIRTWDDVVGDYENLYYSLLRQ